MREYGHENDGKPHAPNGDFVLCEQGIQQDGILPHARVSRARNKPENETHVGVILCVSLACIVDP
jgi:hypothetical protein